MNLRDILANTATWQLLLGKGLYEVVQSNPLLPRPPTRNTPMTGHPKHPPRPTNPL